MDINSIYTAAERIRPYLPKTPLLFSPLLQKKLKIRVYFKLETQNPTGSFKPRPAFNSILANLAEAKAHGVIASSSGNFAQGVAYAARELGLEAIIVMMQQTSPYKVERTKQLGAEVVLCGNKNLDRIETTLELQKKTGRLLVYPYDSDETIAGDGTIGLELHEDLGEMLKDTTVLVPVSGGGLLAGIAFALKSLQPKCKVIGLQSKNCNSMIESLKAGHPVDVGPFTTIADALVASIPGEKPFAIIQKYVDDMISLNEHDIESATRFLIEEHKLVVEPSGALPIAALLTNQVTAPHVVCILSGGNINLWKS